MARWRTRGRAPSSWALRGGLCTECSVVHTLDLLHAVYWPILDRPPTALAPVAIRKLCGGLRGAGKLTCAGAPKSHPMACETGSRSMQLRLFCSCIFINWTGLEPIKVAPVKKTHSVTSSLTALRFVSLPRTARRGATFGAVARAVHHFRM